MEKGLQTKEKILSVALNMARAFGLDSLTLGEVAKKAAMSKSGVFAHFQSREDLLRKVLEFTFSEWKSEVFDKAILAKRGLPRILALSDLWLKWDDNPHGGCPILSASFEFDDRPGIIHDLLVKSQSQVIGILAKAGEIAVEEKHFRSDADCRQFAFEVYGNILSYNLHKKLLKDPKSLAKYRSSFQRILNHYLDQ